MRDLDVLNGRLLQGAMLQVPEHAPAIATLVTMLDDERDDALNRHRQLRATARYTGLAVRLEEAAHDMPSRGRGERAGGQPPAATAAPHVARPAQRGASGATRKQRGTSAHRQDPREAVALRVRGLDRCSRPRCEDDGEGG